MTILSISVHI